MNNKYRIVKKACNVFAVASMMLGLIPAPVLARVSTAYAAEKTAVDGAVSIDQTLATSYAGLLGSTSSKADAEELVVSLPDISGKHGDWLSIAISEPVAACEGENCTPEEPAEEPVGEEPPAEEPIVEEPAEEAAPEEVDLCPDDENKVEPGVCGCGVSDVDTDADGTEDCEDTCPLDETNTCLDVPIEEPACEEELCDSEAEQTPEPEVPTEPVLEVVEVAAEKEVVLADETGEPLQMATQETANLLVEGDPLIVRGGVNYYFLTDCSGIIAPDVCSELTTPLTDAVIFANSGETIAIAAGTYNENVLVDKDVILLGGSGGVMVSSFTLSHPVTSLASWTNINTNLVYITTDVDSQGSIQDGVDLVDSGGVVDVGEGTYEESVSINKPLELNGNIGNPTLPGPGKDAPEIKQSSGSWQTGTGIDVQSADVTIHGFVFKGFK